MTETATTTASARCPFRQTLTYRTGDVSIALGYDDLTGLMRAVLDVWDSVIADSEDEEIKDAIGQKFDALMDRIDAWRKWTAQGNGPVFR